MRHQYYITIITCCFLSILNFKAISQYNYIINGSFEIYNKCPTGFTLRKMTMVSDWKQPTGGTPDYFNKCSRSESNPKDNFAGAKNPIDGKGYIGLILYSDVRSNRTDGQEYREYIQQKLRSNLVKDTLYYFSMYLSLAQTSNIAVNTIGISLSRRSIKRFRYQGVLSTKTFLMMNIGAYQDKYRWIKVSGYFLAPQNATNLIIGNFTYDKDLFLEEIIIPKKYVKLALSGRNSYYYLDSVSIYKALDIQKYVDSIYLCRSLNNGANPEIQLKTNVINSKDTLITLHLNFADNNKGINTLQDTNEIKDLAEFIRSNHSDSLIIIGHTDSTGNRLHDLNLSIKQAKAVYDFLVNKLPGKQITYYGMGSDRPKTANNTPEGRQENRRIDIFMQIHRNNKE